MNTTTEAASAGQPHAPSSGEEIRAAYECHTLVQILLEHIAGSSSTASWPSAAPPPYQTTGPQPTPWSCPGVWGP